MWESYTTWKLESCIEIKDGEIAIEGRFHNPNLMAIHVDGCQPNILIYSEPHFDLLCAGTAKGKFKQSKQKEHFMNIMSAMKDSNIYKITYDEYETQDNPNSKGYNS